MGRTAWKGKHSIGIIGIRCIAGWLHFHWMGCLTGVIPHLTLMDRKIPVEFHSLKWGVVTK